MKIKQKLIAACGLIAIFVLIFAAFSIQSIKTIHDCIHETNTQTVPAMDTLQDMKFAGLRIVSSTSEYGFLDAEKRIMNLRRTSPAEIETAPPGEQAEENLIAFGVTLFTEKFHEYQRLQALSPDSEANSSERLWQRASEIIKLSDQIITLKKRDIAGKEILNLKEKLENVEMAFLSLIDELVQKKEAEVAAQEEAIHALITRYLRTTVAISLFLIILVIGTSLLLSRLIAKPIHQLARAASKVGEGELDLKVQIPTKDELGELAHNFNKMIADLKSSAAALHTHQENLEKQVKERTQALQSANETLQLEMAARKNIAQDKAKAEARLRQAQKLEAVGTLAGGIAHDFNNLLAAILGFAELAQRQLQEKNESQIAEDVEEIIEAGKRARDLVKQLLAFSRLQEEVATPINPQLVVKEAIKLLRAFIPATIAIENPELQSGTILIAPTNLHQVVMNLCTNAFHAMEETGGILSISLRDVELKAQDLAGQPELQPGAYVELMIRDTGIGIDPAVQEKMFDPYFTTKSEEKGSGMGLAVVHGIVKKCNGTIRVKSAPGRGSSFQIYFPRMECPHLKEAAEMGSIPWGEETILLVDDQPGLAHMATRHLECLGYKIETCTDSLEALALFQIQPARFDLVVSDQTMPHLTGLELARKISRRRPDLPLILWSGNSSTIDPDEARAAGIREILPKPFSQHLLAVTVRRVLDGSAAATPRGTAPAGT